MQYFHHFLTNLIMILLELMYTYHFHWRPSDDNALA